MKTLLLACAVVLLAVIASNTNRIRAHMDVAATPAPVLTEAQRHREMLNELAHADGYCGSNGCDIQAWAAHNE